MKKLRIILSLVLLVGLGVGLTGIIRQQLDYRKGAEDYADAQIIAQQPPSAPEAPAQEPEQDDSQTEENTVDLAALRSVNPDVVAWIDIPGTDISYPVVQTTDNDYYLTHTWKKETSSVGAIFMDYRSDAALGDFNTLLYGHRMRNGSMFAGLKDYQDQSFWEAAPSIFLTNADGTHRYDIFAACQAKVDAALYTPGAESQTLANEALTFVSTRNALRTDITPSSEDRILTLITCTGTGYSARWVVQAVLVPEE